MKTSEIFQEVGEKDDWLPSEIKDIFVERLLDGEELELDEFDDSDYRGMRVALVTMNEACNSCSFKECYSRQLDYLCGICQEADYLEGEVSHLFKEVINENK